MNRREWLKRIGLGSLALTSLPTILTGRATPAWADSGTTMNFHFSAISQRPGFQGPDQRFGDRLVMAGSGKFTVQHGKKHGRVKGQGSFAHYDATLPPGQNIVSFFTGTWQTTGFVSFDLFGLYGTDSEGNNTLAAGLLVMDIVLVRPGTPTRVPSLLALVSTLPPAGLPNIPSTFVLDGIPSPFNVLDGVILRAPNIPEGFLFTPIDMLPNPDVPPEDKLSSSEPAVFLPVVFSTLNESRSEP
jgi:hypothetical protein